MKIGTSDLTKLYLGSAEVDKVYIGTDLVYGGGGGHDYSTDYLTFVALEDGTFKFSGNSIDYSVDDGQTWVALAANTATATIPADSKILWRASGLTPNSSAGIGTFSSTGRFEAEGNIMTLRDGTTGGTALSSYQFKSLFNGATGLTSTENLVLPATTLATSCYESMFYHCTGLTTAPELPATTLAGDCYSTMFQGCTSLTTAPQLPATTLAGSCYYIMFMGCTSLTTAPELPATTLENYCYLSMFWGCTSLTTAPQLPATTLAEGCYDSMFRGCGNLNSITCLATDISASNCTNNWLYNVSSTGTFTKAASMTGWPTGDSGIPTGWTVQDYQG